VCIGMSGLARPRCLGPQLLHHEELGHHLQGCRLLERRRHQVQELHDMSADQHLLAGE
jgi:hypothetical protein